MPSLESLRCSYWNNKNAFIRTMKMSSLEQLKCQLGGTNNWDVETYIQKKNSIQYTLDLRKILGVAKKFLKSRSFLFQTQENPYLPI